MILTCEPALPRTTSDLQYLLYYVGQLMGLQSAGQSFLFNEA